MSQYLHTLHTQIIQEYQFSGMLSHEIQRQTEYLDRSIKQIIFNLRNFSLLDTWYPKLSESNIQQFLKSPIAKRDVSKIYESPSALPFSTSVTLKVNTFLKNITPYIPILCKCAIEYFSEKPPKVPFVPDANVSFFAASSFPSLFGYGWCIEQGVCYVNSLVDLIVLQVKRCGSIYSTDFQNSFIRDACRIFLHTTGIQSFLQAAFNQVFMEFLYDNSFSSLKPDSLEYFEKLTKYAGKLSDGIYNSLNHMPTLIKYFLAQAYDAISTRTNQQPADILEFLFIDLTFQSAILNPKLFALIPENAVAPRISSQSSSLSRFFRWSLHPSTLPQHFQQYQSNPAFQKLSFPKILAQLSTFQASFENSSDGVFSAKLQQVSDERYHYLLLSINDVAFLTEIVNKTIANPQFLSLLTPEENAMLPKLQNLCKIQFPVDELSQGLVDFWFQNFKLPPQPFTPPDLTEQSEVVLPLFPQGDVDLSTISNYAELKPLVNHLIIYFQTRAPDSSDPLQSISQNISPNINSNIQTTTVPLSSDISNNAGVPNTFNPDFLAANNSFKAEEDEDFNFKTEENNGSYLVTYLEEQLKKANERGDSQDQSRTQTLLSKISNEDVNLKELIEATQMTIDNKVASQKKKLGILFDHKECSDNLDSLRNFASTLNNQLIPIIHQTVLRHFHSTNKATFQDVTSGILKYVSRDSDWIQLFTEVKDKLIAFAESIELDRTHFTKIIRQLNSLLVNEMTYATFKQVNLLQLKDLDNEILAQYDDLLEEFKSNLKSKRVKSLINNPNSFNQAVQILICGTSNCGPLERVEQIDSALKMAKEIYRFENGEKSSEKENELLLKYLVLKAKLPELASLKRFFDHYLLSLNPTIRILTPEEKVLLRSFSSIYDYITKAIKK